MADESTLLSQSLVSNQEAANMRDPFLKAQQAYQSNLTPPQQLSSSVVQPTQDKPSNEPSMTSKAPQTNLLFSPASATDMAKFSSSQIPKALQQLGVNDKGLALTDLGKLQLVGRLKDKFGESYSDSPQVMNILAMFDKTMNLYKPLAQPAVAGGQRTLAALLGG